LPADALSRSPLRCDVLGPMRRAPAVALIKPAHCPGSSPGAVPGTDARPWFPPRVRPAHCAGPLPDQRMRTTPGPLDAIGGSHRTTALYAGHNSELLSRFRPPNRRPDPSAPLRPSGAHCAAVVSARTQPMPSNLILPCLMRAITSGLRGGDYDRPSAANLPARASVATATTATAAGATAATTMGESWRCDRNSQGSGSRKEQLSHDPSPPDAITGSGLRSPQPLLAR
jgi:hypothetical protein